MQVQYVALWAILQYLAAAQTPLGSAPAAQQGLSVIFNDRAKTVPISGGMLVSPKDTIPPPAVLPLDYAAESFFLIMLDLDIAVNATTRTTLLHWMEQDLVDEPSSQNLSAKSTEQESIIAPYISPNPTPGTGKHRYLILLFSQPLDFKFPKAFDYLNRPTNETLRAAFNVTKFAAVAGLGEPVGATFWLEQSVNASSNSTTGSTGSSAGSAAATWTTGPGATPPPSPIAFMGTGHRLGSGCMFVAGVSALCALTLVLV